MPKYILFLILFSSLNIFGQNYCFLDTFENFNKSQWLINEYGFEGIGCNMTSENLEVSNNLLQITLNGNHDTIKHKPFIYNSSGIQSVAFYKYGYFCTRMKSEIIRGTVSSFFLMNKWVPNDWIHKEIDIEFLGKNLKAVQLTTHLIDTRTNNWQSESITIPLNFSIAQEYHDFCILWTPDSVAWYADNQLLHVEKKFIPDEPMQVLMNHWNADSLTMDWLGGLISSKELPSKVFYSKVAVQNLEQYRNNINNIINIDVFDIKLYPNPTNHKIHFKLPCNCNASIVSATGNILHNYQLKKGNNEVDISQLKPGIYFLKLNNTDKVVTRKFAVI